MVPRQSDAAIGPLLDTVFDTRELSHGPLPYDDLNRLYHWLSRIAALGNFYLTAGATAHDVGVFSPELGRFADALVRVAQALADCMMAELDAHPGATIAPADQRNLAKLRGAAADSFNDVVNLLHTPGLTVGWVQDRLTALRAAAPTMARFLTPEQIARLRGTTIRLAAGMHEKSLRAGFGSVAVALAEPAPPAPVVAASGSGEIALESDGQAYTVPGRINGAATIKFFVDSGASVVSLPKDLVEDMTKAGTIAASDLRGRDVYVTADGKRHRGTLLMLHQLDVGGHTVTNVMASVAPAHSAPLLGQTFLAKFKSWTLDNKRHVLVIVE